jgi:soluble lytic murein transglycosylase-like protein
MNRSDLIGRLAQLHHRARWRSPLGGALTVLLLAVAASPAAIATPDSDSPEYADIQKSDTPKSDTKIYKYLRNGTASFSDIRPNKGSYVVYRPSCYACNLASNIDWHSTPLHPDKYGDEINLAARQFDLDPALVRAVIHAESGFNARARSPKGAIGLMQLMPGTARMLGVTDAHVPGHNIRGGAQYLADLLAQFKNDVGLAAAAYNAGPEAVQRYAGVPPYPETQVYVQRVKILHQRYKNSPRG